MTDVGTLRAGKILAAKDYAVLIFVIVVFIILNHAGSLIASPAAALGGLLGIIGYRIPGPKCWPVAVWIGLTFIAWCLISSLWSPYESERAMPAILRYAFGMPLYGLLIFILLQQPESRKRVFRLILMILLPLSAAIFAIDFVSDYAVFRLGAPNAVTGDIIKNLAHGLSVLLMCMGTVIILLLRHGRGGMMLAAALFMLATIAAANSGNTAALLCVPAIILFMVLGYRFPKASVTACLALPIAGILLAPVVSILASEATQATKDAMPFSWEWRTETWGYLSSKIMVSPLAGNGFDSLRTMKDTFDARGFEGLSLVPLHAHNFGLQVWVELGLVGAIIASLFFWECAAALRKTKWLSARRASALCATMVTAIIFSTLSYSAWQDWWWGAIGFALAFVTLIPDELDNQA